MADSKPTQFDDVFLNLSKHRGRLRLHASGLGWKSSHPSQTDPYTVPASDIRRAIWSHASRGYSVKIILRNGSSIVIDGFDESQQEKVEKAMKEHFNVALENREHSLRGWNWGKAKFEGNELVFQVGTRSAFEVPLGKVNNTNLVGKTEVAVEFALDKEGKKEVEYGDELVEMRFYVPGMKEKDKEGSDVEDEKDEKDEEEAEETTAASDFYETLKDKASIGEIAGESIVTFTSQLLTTPRGRYDVDMYATFLRLRGKTYDYKINYEQVVKLFLLPKPDDAHVLFVVGVDPPLRQGQTRYPFLVIQFTREEDMEVELNIEEFVPRRGWAHGSDVYQQEYASRLKQSYDAPAYDVVSSIFRGLTGRKIITPGAFSSHVNQPGVKCALKASEGILYPLEKYLLFVPKPTILIDLDDIEHVTFSRVAASVQATRTFDLTVELGGTTHAFLNLNREEQKNLEPYFKSKKIRIRNDLDDNSEDLLKKALADESDSELDEPSSDDEEDRPAGGEDEDSEEDEDFQEDSDDEDVAEEYDENAKGSDSGDEDASSGDGSDDDDDMDVDDDDDEEGEEEERPAKKAKTKK